MYYPKSQIKTNLYTNGEEYVTSNGESYVGFYHEISNGSKYTGKSPQDQPNQLLTQIISLDSLDNPTLKPSDKIIETYLEGGKEESDVITEFNVLPYYSLTIDPSQIKRSLPSPIQTLPTQQDKDLGAFSRYFCKKNNENIYIEINKEQYTKFNTKDKTVAWDLYTPKQVLWQIKGGKTQTYNANKNNITLIEQRDKWYGFTQYFKDRFLKYYLES